MKAWSRKSGSVQFDPAAATPRLLTVRAGTAPANRQSGGFTLIETIVALAAVALVAVGLANIFDAVGKTVKGGKRVSLLNQYAGLVENQMRKDFGEITRDGFLTIRHEWADKNQDGRFDPNVDRIPLYPDDPNPRARRCDQIIFFSNGKHETARQPVHPDVVVSSDTAMIYYGHGQQRRRDSVRVDPVTGNPTQPDVIYYQPKVDDNNADNFSVRESRLGAAPTNGPLSTNPNYYPADWTLVRHATLLAKPKSTSGVSVPGVLKFGNDTLDPSNAADQLRLRDYDYQIGLQPAARSVFRALNRYYPSRTDGSLPRNAEAFREPRRPNLTSGIVDIASTSLREIKSIVEGFGGQVPQAGGAPSPRTIGGNRILPAFFDLTSSPGIDLELLYYSWAWTDPASAVSENNDLDVMHVWMEQAFPGESPMGPAIGNTAALRAADPWGVRMRVEPQPVDLIGTLGNELRSVAGGSVQPDQQIALERMDQLMLAGNGFLPHCSEFIVEWSFGLVDPIRKETIWYGPTSRYDSNGDGTVDPADSYGSLSYPFNVLSPTQAAEVYSVRVPRLPAKLLDSPSAQPIAEASLPDSARYFDHVVTPRLIYGYNPSSAEISTTAHFGYADPTYKQDVLRWSSSSRNFVSAPLGDGIKDYGHQVDVNGNGTIEVREVFPGEPAATTIPWAWPKMVRVTITLSDATEPAVENTFQFVFSLPADDAVVAQP